MITSAGSDAAGAAGPLPAAAAGSGGMVVDLAMVT